MLGNCDEKMVLISSSNTNQWPQNQRLDEKNNMMASTSRLLMEKQPPVFHEQNQQQQHQQQQQPPLKCPRCDSSNTKFCYYNNYSLSQPRHFCKACKRYWTRGGTLRNVPVGGGCRKNKRVKRHSSSSTSSSANIDGVASNSSSNPATPTTTTAANPNPNPNSTTTQHPLFYGLPPNPSDLNLPFSRFSSCGYDLQPQLNALGLGFSSGFMSGDGNYHNGFNPNKQIQDVVSSSSLLSNFPNPTSSPTMASLLASSFHQQKFTNNSGILRSTTTTPQAPNDNHFNSLTSFEDRMQMAANGTNTDGTIGMKEMKAEEAQNRMDWNIAGCQNQMEQIGLSDPNSLYWNSTSVGGWHDQTNNIGSSVTSLI